MALQHVSCQNEGCGWNGMMKDLDEHIEICEFQLVPCEMKDFGCKEMVLRKNLATHMRESELQHLTGMAALNLRLTRQLYQDLAEKGKKIDQLQQEVTKQKQLQTEMRREMTEQGQLQAEIRKEVAQQKLEVMKRIQQVEDIAKHVEVHSTGQLCRKCVQPKDFVFDKYSRFKGSGNDSSSTFYSSQYGYKFKLHIKYHVAVIKVIGVFLHLLPGEYDDQLFWPVNVKARIKLLNQAGDHHHVVRTCTYHRWQKTSQSVSITVDDVFMKYSDLEERGDGVQYMMNDCLKFRLHLTVMSQ